MHLCADLSHTDPHTPHINPFTSVRVTPQLDPMLREREQHYNYRCSLSLSNHGANYLPSGSGHPDRPTEREVNS